MCPFWGTGTIWEFLVMTKSNVRFGEIRRKGNIVMSVFCWKHCLSSHREVREKMELPSTIIY